MTIQAVDLLMEYENTISKLYIECANKFPEHGLFWKKSGRTLTWRDVNKFALNEWEFNKPHLKSSARVALQIKIDLGKLDQ